MIEDKAYCNYPTAIVILVWWYYNYGHKLLIFYLKINTPSQCTRLAISGAKFISIISFYQHQLILAVRTTPACDRNVRANKKS